MVPRQGNFVRFTKEFLEYHENRFGTTELSNYINSVFEVDCVAPSIDHTCFVYLKNFTITGGSGPSKFMCIGPAGEFGSNRGSPIVFEIVENYSKASSTGPAPRNNDGRDTCFWCCVPTQKRGGGNYDICPLCGL